MIATATEPNKTDCECVSKQRPQLTFFDMDVYIVPQQKPERIQKIIDMRKRNTEARNERIRLRFNHLYNIERKRLDDVVNTLATEFCLAKSTIESALKH